MKMMIAFILITCHIYPFKGLKPLKGLVQLSLKIRVLGIFRVPLFLNKRPIPIFLERHHQFFIRIHHNRPAPGDGLVQWLARNP